MSLIEIYDDIILVSSLSQQTRVRQIFSALTAAQESVSEAKRRQIQCKTDYTSACVGPIPTCGLGECQLNLTTLCDGSKCADLIAAGSLSGDAISMLVIAYITVGLGTFFVGGFLLLYFFKWWYRNRNVGNRPEQQQRVVSSTLTYDEGDEDIELVDWESQGRNRTRGSEESQRDEQHSGRRPQPFASAGSGYVQLDANSPAHSRSQYSDSTLSSGSAARRSSRIPISPANENSKRSPVHPIGVDRGRRSSYETNGRHHYGLHTASAWSDCTADNGVVEFRLRVGVGKNGLNVLQIAAKPPNSQETAKKPLQASPNTILQAETHVQLGNKFRHHRLLNDALKEYETALKLYLQCSAEANPAVAELKRAIATVHSMQGDSKAANANHDKKLEQSRSSGVQSHEEAAKSMMEAGQIEQAVDEFKKALKAAIKQNGDSGSDVLNIRRGLADAFHAIGKNKEAIEALEAVLSSEIKRLGEMHIDVADTRWKLAIIYEDVIKMDAALEQYNHILKTYVATFGESHLSVADVHCNTALIFIKQNRFAEALAELRAAQRIQVACVGEENLAAACTKTRIGDVFKAQSMYEDALREYRLVLATQRRFLSNNHVDCAATALKIAEVYRLQGRNDEALYEFEEIIRMLEADHGSTHIAVANARWKVADILSQQQDYDRAKAEYLRVLAILTSNNQAVGGDVIAEVRESVGLVYYRTGKFEQAVKELQSSLAAISAVANKEGVKARIHCGLAEVLCAQGKQELALTEYGHALQIRQGMGSEPLAVADTHVDTALAYEDLGMYEEAVRELRTAMELRHEVLGAGHHEVSAVRRKVLAVQQVPTGAHGGTPSRKDVLHLIEGTVALQRYSFSWKGRVDKLFYTLFMACLHCRCKSFRGKVSWTSRLMMMLTMTKVC